jgi:DNA ligase-4
MHASPNDKNPNLHRVFAECLARPEEGLVLKAGEAIYNDYRFPWVKLKRDYIPGYGDCLDLVVLGVSWEKDCARELRGARLHFIHNYNVFTDKSRSKSLLTRIPHSI